MGRFLDWLDPDWRGKHTRWIYLKAGPQDAALEAALAKMYGDGWRKRERI